MSSMLVTTQPLSARPTKILNDLYPNIYPDVQTSNTQVFHLFGGLPLEIRLVIWALALPRQQRLIEVVVKPSPSIVSDAELRADDLSASPASARRYRLGFVTRHTSPSLLSVNREARNFAKKIHRVSIPFLPDDELAARCRDGGGHFRFDPGSDIVFFNTVYDFELLLDFLQDAQTFDSENRGVQNLALDNGNMFGMTSKGIWSAVDSGRRLMARSALMNIEKVYFIDTVSLNLSNPISTVPSCSESMPLTSRQETFSLIPSDPRPVRGDVSLICIACDPYHSIQEWKSMEKACELYRSESVPFPAFYYLLKRQQYFEIRTNPIESREDAMRYVRGEDRLRRLARHEGENGEEGRSDIHGRDMPEPQTPLSAVGFWLFAFDPVYETPPGNNSRKSLISEGGPYRRLITTIRRPQLGLFHLLRRNAE